LRAWAAYFDGALEEPPAFTLLDVKVATAKIAAAPVATAKYLLIFTLHLGSRQREPNRADVSQPLRLSVRRLAVLKPMLIPISGKSNEQCAFARKIGSFADRPNIWPGDILRLRMRRSAS
jgi:hypothetical protein